MGGLQSSDFIQQVKEETVEDQMQKHPRTVYLRFNFDLKVEDFGEQNGRDHRYRAFASDYQHVEAFGFTPEGALTQCELKLNEWIKRKLEEEAKA